MGKLTQREIQAVVSELQKAQNKKLQEFKDNIDYTKYPELTAILGNVDSFIETLKTKELEVKTILKAADELVKDGYIDIQYRMYFPYITRKVDRYKCLLDAKLIEPPKLVSCIDMENFIIINNNGSIGDLLDMAKNHFNL